MSAITDLVNQLMRGQPSAGMTNSRIATSSSDLQNQLNALQAQLAALPARGGIASAARRLTLTKQIADAKLRLQNFEADPAGITPAPDGAPTLGARIEQPKVGFDALKIFLPSQS
jgi:hypothetical protein